ncbi:hypothetical protein FRB93_003698 [Tulasnella sp. JGI-2019a]|nr:hypothetical protein FRB93_003698 [Tulasnella sp. JGI-2019a]
MKTKYKRLSQKERDLLEGYVVAEWNKLNQDGQRPTLNQIAADAGVSRVVVSEILAMHRIRIPVPRPGQTHEQAARICDEWTRFNWPSQKAFAKHHDINWKTLTKILRDCGLLPPKGRHDKAASRHVTTA